MVRKLGNRKIVEQRGICPICHEEYEEHNEIVPDHKNPKGMGGAWRDDDHPDNIRVVRYWGPRQRLTPPRNWGGELEIRKTRPLIS